jgi:cytochrome c553
MFKRLFLLVLLMPVGVLAQEPLLSGQRLAATCANCHGTLGNPVDKSFAPLAGMPSATLQSSMKAFREGSRTSTVMQQLAKGFSDEQVKLIAAFYAAQKKEAQ